MELGFGRGEHLLSYAAENPRTLCLGAETFKNGVAGLLKAVKEEKRENIRVFWGDGLELLARLPGECLNEIFILYPDPWPKKRHHKRRLINPEFLQGPCLRNLKPGGRALIVTDWADYARRITEAVDKESFFCKKAKPNVATRYRQKAVKAGRESFAISLTKR